MYYEIWWKTLSFAVFQRQWDWVLPNVGWLWPFMKTMGITFFVTFIFLQGHRISGNKTDCLHTSDTMFSIKLKSSMNVICVHMYSTVISALLINLRRRSSLKSIIMGVNTFDWLRTIYHMIVQQSWSSGTEPCFQFACLFPRTKQ